MSRFLGPVHHWMYDKIRMAEDINKRILLAFDNNYKDEVDAEYPINISDNLEDVIDLSNIHGWLSKEIATVESRLAFIVINLLYEDENNMKKIEEIFFKYAASLKNLNKSSPENIYSSLTRVLLDGMPCDQCQRVVASSDSLVKVEIIENMHEKYYEESFYGVALYNDLRKAFIKGFLEDTDYVLSDFEKDYFIIKKIDDKNAIDILMNEHQNILRMIKVVRELSLKAMENKEISIPDVRSIAGFIKGYADKLHHEKEEEILFQYMSDELDDVARTLINHGMLVEHDQGRLHVKSLLDAATSYENEVNNRSLLDILTELMGWSNLLERHIEKEDTVVYPYAQRSLSKDSLSIIDEKSVKYDEVGNNIEDAKKYLLLLENLENKYLF